MSATTASFPFLKQENVMQKLIPSLQPLRVANSARRRLSVCGMHDDLHRVRCPTCLLTTELAWIRLATSSPELLCWLRRTLKNEKSQ
jgi:hypothetical protein